MIVIQCTCDSTKDFKSPVLWRAHYDDNRPRSASARQKYAMLHVPHVVFEGRGLEHAPEHTTSPQERRLLELLKEINGAFDYIKLLESEQLTLLNELMPPPPSGPKIFPGTYYRGRAMVPCVECGKQTLWRKSTVPGGLPMCRDGEHRESVKQTRGISDAVWAIVLDEEVDDNA